MTRGGGAAMAPGAIWENCGGGRSDAVAAWCRARAACCRESGADEMTPQNHIGSRRYGSLRYGTQWLTPPPSRIL
jgi:hypothetical protein